MLTFFLVGFLFIYGMGYEFDSEDTNLTKILYFVVILSTISAIVLINVLR